MKESPCRFFFFYAYLSVADVLNIFAIARCHVEIVYCEFGGELRVSKPTASLSLRTVRRNAKEKKKKSRILLGGGGGGIFTLCSWKDLRNE